jgi:DNA polymerase-3 subunit epsilon
MKEFIYDLETTGLDVNKCAIHQLHAIIVIDGNVREHLDIHMSPFTDALVTEEALKVCNVTREHIDAYPSQEEGFRLLIAVLSRYVNRFNKKDKFYLIGYNNLRFDNELLRAFFTRNGCRFFGSWFWSNSVDVMTVASLLLHGKRQSMPDFRLQTVADMLGVEYDREGLHDASTDAEITYRIYKEFITKFMKAMYDK